MSGLGGAVAGGVFGVGLLYWAFASAGFGHGSYLPAALIGAPVSTVVRFGGLIAPIWWAATGYAIGRRRARAVLVLLALHVAGAAVSVARGTPWESTDEQWQYLARAGQRIPQLVWPGFAFHMTGIVVTLALALRQLVEERCRPRRWNRR